MAGIYEDVVASVGNTPLVRVNKLVPGGVVLAKLESRNPLASVKDRIGVAMIDAAERAASGEGIRDAVPAQTHLTQRTR